jgi:hypothetical protein
MFAYLLGVFQPRNISFASGAIFATGHRVKNEISANTIRRCRCCG